MYVQYVSVNARYKRINWTNTNITLYMWTIHILNAVVTYGCSILYSGVFVCLFLLSPEKEAVRVLCHQHYPAHNSKLSQYTQKFRQRIQNDTSGKQYRIYLDQIFPTEPKNKIYATHFISWLHQVNYTWLFFFIMWHTENKETVQFNNITDN